MTYPKSDALAKRSLRHRRLRCRSRSPLPRRGERALVVDRRFRPHSSLSLSIFEIIAPGSRRGRQRGFSLIELAIVIAAMALMVGGLMVPLSAQLERYRMRETEMALAQAMEALLGHAAIHRRLPCPDIDDDGLEDLSIDPAKPDAHPCRRFEGGIPWMTLGVSGLDGWNRRIRYRGNDAYTRKEGVPNPPATIGSLLIRDRVGDEDLVRGNPGGPAAILFSCGMNGVPDGENDGRKGKAAAIPPNGCTNPVRPANARYEYGPPARSDSGEPDDMLVWLSKYVLLNRLIRAGVWP
ncbi:type II secretion system protein [Thioalkalivibrio sp. HK1]|uniref:type II secretion system protein n=1 Tax=Thioalkalivibrio sp. HK1 TaxID=1469245 RepID=UPI000472CD91|nr:type II secretion system protein [Thioalkalivibrio sp. HK1]